MNEDRVIAALRRLGDEELSIGADRAIRGRLELAWRPRAPRVRGFPSIRRFAPILASLVLVAALGGSALGASADSPLWGARVAFEDAAAVLRLSTDDRVAYLLDLVQSRVEEAARQEAAGHPAAAASARAAASSAVAALDGSIPTTELPLPSESPTASAPPANSPSPSPSPSASGSPSATSAAPRSSVPSTAPTRTDSPRTATPTPKPTTTKPTITFAGAVRDANGGPVSAACISTSPLFPTSTTQCVTKSKNGSYGFSAPASAGQTITLYAYWSSPSGEKFAGTATSPATAPTTVMPAITITLRK